MKIMKLFSASLLTVLLGSLLFLFCFNSGIGDIDQTILRKVQRYLLSDHFAPKNIDDVYSQQVFDKYIEALDPYKRFFLQSDIASFKEHEKKMDDYLLSQDTDFHKYTIDVLYKRVEQMDSITQKILEQPISFETDEYYADAESRSYAKDLKEIQNEWKKYIKLQILQEVASELEQDSLKKKPLDSVFLNAKNETADNLKEYFRKFKARKKKDWFSVYINSFTEVFDPHTNYFSPKESNSFNTNMSGKIIGIGALLRDQKGILTISELVVGGPAWKSKLLEVGDKILKVGQKPDELVSVEGMLLEDAVQLIRGKLHTKVYLVIKKKDGSIQNISLVREEVELEDTFVKSIVIETPEKEKIGYISLPEFYVDLENRSKRDCSDDVKNEIEHLKKQNVKGIIFDLRNNGGGSLKEVVEIAGFFIPKGPIVQVKSSDKELTILEDTDSSVLWNGPLTIMVNEYSASASEIFAAAMQDYKRALIVGSSSTYGKGTVQRVIPLDNNFSSEKLGALKLTVQKFYRINGSSTQQKGVQSDIILPQIIGKQDFKEKSQKFSLAWDEIAPVKYTIIPQKINTKLLNDYMNKRLKNNPYIAAVERGNQWLSAMENEKKIPLKFESYQTYNNERKNATKKIDAELKYSNSLSFRLLEKDQTKYSQDTVFKAKKDNWMKDLKKDFYLNENVYIITKILK